MGLKRICAGANEEIKTESTLLLCYFCSLKLSFSRQQVLGNLGTEEERMISKVFSHFGIE